MKAETNTGNNIKPEISNTTFGTTDTILANMKIGELQ
jgi:hypothetical protein